MDAALQHSIQESLARSLEAEVRRQNMGTAELRLAFEEGANGRARLDSIGLSYLDDAQFIGARGRFTDGKLFVVTTETFDGCPNQRARRLAEDLVRSHDIEPTLRAEKLKMSRLGEKLKSVADSSKALATSIETRADAFLSRKDALEKRAESSFAPHEALLTDAEGGLTEIEKALAQLSNGGPPLADSANSSTP